MSCNYAEGLSPYDNKGVLGLPETFDNDDKLEKKCLILSEMIKSSKHVVVHTGAGISTSAGIPDFRGPNGVWTLEKAGKKPSTNISFSDAQPTKTHMILRKLVELGIVKFIISQNIDSLHMRSGLGREYLSELHGNMFVNICNVCDRQYIRDSPVPSVGKRCLDLPCPAAQLSGRPCRGKLYDAVLDWEHSLPERELMAAEYQSSIADLSICLGTTLQIVPSGNLPLDTVRYGGRLVICNLQPTKHDNKADLKINYYVDEILERVMKNLNIKIPQYDKTQDPTYLAKETLLQWTIERSYVVQLEKAFKSKCKGVKKKRLLVKRRRSDIEDNNFESENKSVLEIIQNKIKTEDINGVKCDIIDENKPGINVETEKNGGEIVNEDTEVKEEPVQNEIQDKEETIPQ